MLTHLQHNTPFHSFRVNTSKPRSNHQLQTRRHVSIPASRFCCQESVCLCSSPFLSIRTHPRCRQGIFSPYVTTHPGWFDGLQTLCTGQAGPKGTEVVWTEADCVFIDEDGRAEEAERVKNEQIQKQKEGKGHWHEEIASDSESIVRCARDTTLSGRKSTDSSKIDQGRPWRH